MRPLYDCGTDYQAGMSSFENVSFTGVSETLDITVLNAVPPGRDGGRAARRSRSYGETDVERMIAAHERIEYNFLQIELILWLDSIRQMKIEVIRRNS
jgi:hypothetical protein